MCSGVRLNETFCRGCVHGRATSLEEVKRKKREKEKKLPVVQKPGLPLAKA